MRLIVVGALASASITLPAKAEVITDGEITAAVIRLITHIPTDTFDNGPIADYTGRTFVIETPVEEFSFDTSQCKPNWSYGRADGVMKVNVTQGLASTYTMLNGPGAELTGSDNRSYQFRPIVCATFSTSSAGQNGFGAQMQIRHRKTTVVGLSKPYRREGLAWSKVVSADEGRALAKALRVRVSGTIGKWGPGGSIGCVREHDDATFTVPLEDDTTTCVVKVNDLRTDLIDSRTGEVLATELPSDADPVKGKRR